MLSLLRPGLIPGWGMKIPQAISMAKKNPQKLKRHPYQVMAKMLTTQVMSNSLQRHGLYSLPGSSVHGILQASTLEWVAMLSSRGSS